MTKAKPDLRALPPLSDPTSSTTSSNGLPTWKPSGPRQLPHPNHPNYIAFLEETAVMAMTAAHYEMESHGAIVMDFMKQDAEPPYTLRDTVFKMTSLSLSAELLAMIARRRKAEAAPTLFHPDGRPL